MLGGEIVNYTLKFKRIRKGYKQYEFAEKVGITPQYLRMLEKGEANPSKALMMVISRELETSVDELFFQDESEAVK